MNVRDAKVGTVVEFDEGVGTIVALELIYSKPKHATVAVVRTEDGSEFYRRPAKLKAATSAS